MCFSSLIPSLDLVRPATGADEDMAAFAGWYKAPVGRYLTVLPDKRERLTAVFFWSPGAPTSVGVVKKSDDGEAIFWQPVDQQPLNEKRDGDRVVSVMAVNIEFEKQCDASSAIGTYASSKNPTMEISSRDGQLYCSIDWKNGAPNTNGWLRAGPSGPTVLEGYKWAEPVKLEFGDNEIKSISIAGQAFKRVEGSSD